MRIFLFAFEACCSRVFPNFSLQMSCNEILHQHTTLSCLINRYARIPIYFQNILTDFLLYDKKFHPARFFFYLNTTQYTDKRLFEPARLFGS